MFSMINQSRSFKAKIFINNFTRFYLVSHNKHSNSDKRYLLFKKIKDIILNSPRNDETQLKIEEFLYDYNISNLDTTISDIYDFIGSVNREFKDVLFESKDRLKDLIKNFKKRKLDVKLKVDGLKQKEKVSYYLSVLLNELSSEFVISILLGKFVVIIHNPLVNKSSCQSVFNEVAGELIRSYYYSLYEKKKKELLKRNQDIRYNMYDWRKENECILNVYDNMELVLGIGAVVVDWLRDVDLVEFKLVKALDETKQNLNIIKVSKRIEDLISKFKVPLNLPNNIPMIVKPKPSYREIDKEGKVYEQLGGYLLNGEKVYNEVILKKPMLRYQTKIIDKNIIYSGINNLNSVGYKINKDVLNFVRLYGVKFGLIIDDSYIHPLKEKLNKERLKKQDKISKWERKELESFNSKKHLEDNILALADVFEDVHEFFIPVRMDFRGRIYCIAEYLNYQGIDLAKSLLLFSKGEEILKTDKKIIDYLKVFGANCYGNKLDKKSWAERVKWVEDNEENIRNFYNGKLILEAELKTSFISFCFEYNRWLDCLENSKSTHFTTYLPIQLDATCNGYQDISMLTRDRTLAEKVNLTESSWEDQPNDLYSYVSSFLGGYFDNKLKEKDVSIEDRESYIRLKSLDIQRELIKLALMTKAYNATAHRIIKYLKELFEFDSEYTKLVNNTSDLNLLEDSYRIDENLKISGKKKNQFWYRYKKNKNVMLEDLDFINLYKALDFILLDIFPSLVNIMKYFKEIASICVKLGLYIPWKLPSGLEPFQSYMKVKDARLKPLSFSKKTFSLKIYIKDQYDKNKQLRALMPNVVHSLDALSLCMLIDNYFNLYNSKFKNIYSIHDCFAVTANNVNYISDTLKIIYIQIYSDKDFLHTFNSGVINNIKLHYGEASFDEDKLLIYVKNCKPIPYPDINKVLKGDLKIESIKYSSYIVS